MIEQYLPQTNESATVAKSKKIRELNQALERKKILSASTLWTVLYNPHIRIRL
jgi:hypothetical protein